MMAAKAQSMCEPPSLAKILETPLAEAAHNPDRFKKIGPEITPYIEAVWVDEREQAVTQGNLLKFCQNAELRSVPLPTGNRIIVEAAPNDAIWGIGMNAEAARAGETLSGSNLLVVVLMAVREALAQPLDLFKVPQTAPEQEAEHNSSSAAGADGADCAVGAAGAAFADEVAGALAAARAPGAAGCWRCGRSFSPNG